jgi:Spy/CpxP family protein refolding chaperone
MKKQLLLLFLLLGYFSAWSQAGGRLAQVKSAKIAFITRELDLTEEEAQKFWPVYNKYEAEREEHRRKLMRDMNDARKNFDQLNDREIEQSIEQYLALRQQEVDIDKKYYPEFKRVLPIKKVAKLYAAEKRFQKEVLRSLQDNRPARPGPGR